MASLNDDKNLNETPLAENTASVLPSDEKTADNNVIYHERKRAYTIGVVRRLAEGNYDAPIVVEGADRQLLRELEILRRGLRDYRDKTEEKERRLSTDVASVAHDMKTPLAVIAGYAECIQAGMTDKDYPTLIYEKAQEMNEQVVGIVEANRRAKQERHFVKVDCREFFTAECEKYSVVAKRKNIEYTVGKPKKGFVYGDESILASIIQNIITNAVKYTDEGGSIKISFAKTAKHYKITVKDNGKGISKEDLPHIFDKYFMVDKSRSTSNSSGLGLYTAKEYVEEHGGEIKVKSEVGKGSRFTVCLPIEDEMLKGTKIFDKMPRVEKLLMLTIGFFLTSVIYRIIRACETERYSDAITAWISFFLCPIIWVADIVAVAFTNKLYGY